MRLVITATDQVLARYGNSLAALGEGQARTALSGAFNHEDDKGRTQVLQLAADDAVNQSTCNVPRVLRGPFGTA